MDKLLELINSPRARSVRVYVALLLVLGSALAWPLSALTWAKDEPQFVLGLSWAAIILTGWDILTTSQVHQEEEEDDA